VEIRAAKAYLIKVMLIFTNKDGTIKYTIQLEQAAQTNG
jgi:hypothetical protein